MNWSAHLFKTLGGHVREQSLHSWFGTVASRGTILQLEIEWSSHIANCILHISYFIFLLV
jgi:hypothetical protein